MKIEVMSAKMGQAGGNIASRTLEGVISGGTAEDVVSNGTVCKIVEASKTGYYDKRMGERVVFVIMQRMDEDAEGKLVDTEDGVQVYLGMFDRIAVPYLKEADGTVVRDKNGITERASGTVVNDWKNAKNAAEFIANNMGKCMKFSLDKTVPVRAWDRVANELSKTELREQNVYKVDWVE